MDSIMIIDLKDIPVIYINMDKDIYKNRKCVQELKKIGFKNIYRIEGVEHDNHQKGCALAHNKALSMLEPPFIIVEDDILIKSFEHIIDVPENADAVYLGVSHWGKVADNFGELVSYEDVNEKIVKIKNMLSAHAILYLQKEYVCFCKHASNISGNGSGVAHDQYFAELQNIYNVYAVKDPLFFQKSQLEITYPKLGDKILPNRKKICVINIATNKYIKFIEPLWESINDNFLQDYVVESLLFTNHDVEPITKNGKVSKIEHEPFPVPTLMRYHYINSESEYLKQFDYCFYLDADMLIEGKVGEEILGDLVATIHPGFFNKSPNEFTYERNETSLAYIPKDSGNKYYAGGFNGGTPEQFLKMSETIAKNIDTDKEHDIIAIWHDESHFNRYLLDNPPTLELSPDYCYPESWNIPFERKILALDKNHNEIRS